MRLLQNLHLDLGTDASGGQADEEVECPSGFSNAFGVVDALHSSPMCLHIVYSDFIMLNHNRGLELFLHNSTKLGEQEARLLVFSYFSLYWENSTKGDCR